MESNTSAIAVFMISFVILLTLFGTMFNVNLTKTVYTEHTNQPVKITETVSATKALAGIMTFQYVDSIPAALSIFLDALAIFTIVIIAVFVRG